MLLLHDFYTDRTEYVDNLVHNLTKTVYLCFACIKTNLPSLLSCWKDALSVYQTA